MVGINEITTFIMENPALFSGILTTSVLAVGVVYTRRQLDHMRRDRVSKLLLELDQVWFQEDFVEARGRLRDLEPEELKKKIEMTSKTNRKKYHMLIRTGDFFEHLGYLVDKNYIDEELALRLYAYRVEPFYKKYSKYIESEQEERGLWNGFASFEKIAKTYRENSERSSEI